MDERHLRVVDPDAAAPGSPIVDLSGDQPVIDVTPEENPWTATTAGQRRIAHPSLQGGPRRDDVEQRVAPRARRDGRIRAYLRLVDGP
jgi:hypothetical protein